MLVNDSGVKDSVKGGSRRDFLRKMAFGVAAATGASSLQASATAFASSDAHGGSQGSPLTGSFQGAFKEAPMLADLVKAGKLPSVDQRIPSNPRVIKPLEAVGKYGGTWHRAYRGPSDRVGPSKIVEEMLIDWDAPDTKTIGLVANLVEKWEQNADASEYVFTLRQGLKWSDGAPVTTDDVMFWYEDINQNKDIRPNADPLIRQKVGAEYKLATIVAVDATTFKVTYAAPNPLLPIAIAKTGGFPNPPAFLAPSHYLKKFHPKYASVDELTKIATEKNLPAWQALWGDAGNMEGAIAFWFKNPELPTLLPWRVTVPAPADPCVLERNPFYWQVDTEGNQLPYIDKIEHAFFESLDVVNLWVAQGKIDMQMRHMSAGSYVFLKENEAKGKYRVLNWRSASTQAYFPNQNCPDPVLAKLFATPEFRQAMNISINREEIAEIVYNGLGVGRQASPVNGSPEFDADLVKMWAEYDPKKANDLLDKLGLTKGSDGIRKRADGKALEVVVEHISPTGSPENDQHELVKGYWAAIGIRATMKAVERSLYEEHCRTGEIEIGNWGFDRSSVVKADPGRWLGTITDGPWAPTYGNWYAKAPFKQEEPPADHPIRKIWDLWDRVQVEPDEARRNALFQELLGVHKAAPMVIGVVGEIVAPQIASNAFGNTIAGYIADDTLRDYGLISPQQFYLGRA